MTSQTIRSNGKIVAFWPAGVPTDSPHTRAIFGLIDPSRISSATSILNGFHAARDNASGDKNLSAQGIRERVGKAALNALANIAPRAADVRRQRAEYEALARQSVVIPKADMADTLFDIELVRQVKAEGKIPSILDMSSERLKLAIVRAPVELSGVSSDVRERLRGSFVSPDLALDLQQRSAAIEAAHEGVQNAITAVAGAVTDMTPIEKRALIGDGFRV